MRPQPRPVTRPKTGPNEGSPYSLFEPPPDDEPRLSVEEARARIAALKARLDDTEERT